MKILLDLTGTNPTMETGLGQYPPSTQDVLALAQRVLGPSTATTTTQASSTAVPPPTQYSDATTAALRTLDTVTVATATALPTDLVSSRLSSKLHNYQSHPASQPKHTSSDQLPDTQSAGLSHAPEVPVGTQLVCSTLRSLRWRCLGSSRTMCTLHLSATFRDLRCCHEGVC